MISNLYRSLKLLVAFVFVLGACPAAGDNNDTEDSATMKFEKVTFAGGCFWCMEPPFEKLDGVIEVLSGYSGGHKANPSYKEVSAGSTGHVEAVQISYDPQKITYEKLLEVYWRQIDPTDAGGSFVDRGPQYRSVIFYHNGEQKRLAEISIENLNSSGVFDKPVVTKLLKYSEFYKAEEYHQDYYKENPLRYKFYRAGSGRDQFLKKTWKTDKKAKKFQKPSDAELRKKLTLLQYNVTQKDGTETAFSNPYWNNKKKGIYVDIVSGEPLFSSLDKYNSGTGWPSFSKPITSSAVMNKEDKRFFSNRTEVRSKHANSHLGHLFDDGPAPDGLRYCINSAALRFIRKEDLEKEGYADYQSLFE